ncbi:MAG: xanthine dehydrogenase family protein molybdopterin-binding subunit [Candidatus Izemoplasmatales bacterium]|nr:xanthine dehydrogenase family protein molybdopterin-binding subunit [Candidatus Izemoplasmatales bacterium]
MKDISTSIKKVDHEEKCSGKALYASDYFFEDMQYARTLRSIIAKGTISLIDIPTLEDGYFIVDYHDIPGKNVVKIIFDDQVIFPENKVTYLGEPILLVVGPDKAKVESILKSIKVHYVEEEPIFEWTDSKVHYHFSKGSLENSFSKANKLIEFDYATSYQEQAYIEPQGFIGYTEGEKVTLIGSIQCPYYVKNALILALNSKPENIRVIQATVGGAFGGKEEFPSLLACQLAVALKKVNKPIKMIYEREEDMISTTKRHPSKIKMIASVNESNEITGLKAIVGIDAGANIGLSGVVLSRALIACTGAYTIEHLDVTGDVYITNTVPNGAFRGFGAPQMLFAIEMFIEHIVKTLNIDPLALRLKYLAKQNDHTSTSGLFRDPIIMPQMIEKAMALSNYKDKANEYSKNNLYKGIGMSWFLHGCGFTGSGEASHIKAKVKLKKNKDGFIEILIAAVDMGQGVRTTMKKIVSDILKLPIEKIIYNLPDTDFVPDSGPTVASRTIMIVGGLVARCALKLKDHINEEEITLEENYVQPSYIKWDESTFTGDAYPAYSWGVNIVEVSVNPITYQTTIEGVWSVYDLGKAIDERIVMGQADGGITQGIAYGYLEVMEHSLGKIMQKNFTDYIIPTSKDISKMETIIMDNPYPLGPYGAKGVGELTLVGGAPAVAKAIEMAIKRKVFSIPMTPEKIMELMNNGND